MINDFNFLGSIHDYDDPYFGYTIVDPDKDDPYTTDDVEYMIYDLSKEYNNGYFYAMFPLQKMINVVMALGGECFWHEVTDAEDMEVFYSKEMLEEMKMNGFKYVARIRTSGDNEEYIGQTASFIKNKAVYYKKDEFYLQQKYFNYIEYVNKGDEKLPKINSAILFSTIPIISDKHEHLLNPIGGEIIKMNMMENDRQIRIKQEEQIKETERKKQQGKNDEQVKKLENFFRKQGVSEEQIDEILKDRGIPNQIHR